MVIFFDVVGLLFWIAALGTCSIAKGAPHEIEGMIAFLIGTVLICAAALLRAINKVAEAIKGK